MSKAKDIFGSMVFNDSVMMQRLPHADYKSLKQTIQSGSDLSRDIADVVANAMKDWAVEKGATHFTHWFQPLNGLTAEKHESFVTPVSNSEVIMEFSGKELIRGESDASALPSGGLRATFEARGYTAWDPTSFAFIKDRTLCIPTAFCSYTGHVLDKKTPLIRSQQALNRQAMRIMKLFGMTDVKRVIATAGAEQEYFLIDDSLFQKRPDLRFTGRTLIGAKSVKGQEMADQYYGALKRRVSDFMGELDEELWKLGVFARTEHNEAAPAQHELAPVYTDVNVACDHNQLMMELMQKLARKHGLACLLHEKPFAGVNGSGKHNNWSLATDTGINLLSPGSNPAENKLFLLLFAAVIRAVDENQDLLRICVSSATNDNRLGGFEAPPTFISMFIGDDMAALLDAIVNKADFDNEVGAFMDVGLGMIPKFKRDATDRNRTSPFAFTGSKFEFRMPGSIQSIAGVNTVMNTIVADVLKSFADRLEKSENFDYDVMHLVRKTVREHKRILFNGNNYTSEWVEEAKQRGLVNYQNTPDAVVHLTDEKNIELFKRHNIYTVEELQSRREVLLDDYAKHIHIEGAVLSQMIRRDILPALSRFTASLATAAETKKRLGVSVRYETSTLEKLAALTDNIIDMTDTLDIDLNTMTVGASEKRAVMARDNVLGMMNRLRGELDSAELLTDAKEWPYPTYAEMLFSVT